MFSEGRLILGLAPAFLDCSGTLFLSTRVLYLNFLVIIFLHQRDILFYLVYVHSDIRYKNCKIFKDVLFFINFDGPVASFHINLI